MSERATPASPGGDTGLRAPRPSAAARLAVATRDTPDAIAVVAVDRTLTYAALDAEIDRVVGLLTAAGATRADAPVGLALGRSSHLVAAVWACLRAGVAYVPLDPAYPPARLAHMVRDAGVRLALVDEAGANAVASDAVTAVDVRGVGVMAPAPCDPVPADALAYVIYTSGSTGLPKGVQVDQANLAHFLDAMGAAVRPARSGRGVFLASTTLSFDPSVVELVWALTAGMTVVLAPSLAAPSAQRASLGTLIERHRVTHAQLTPSRARVLLADDDERRALARLEQVFVGGEVLTARLAADLLDAGVDVVTNLYGPTETTVWAFAHACAGPADAVRAGGPVPVGAPLPGYPFRVVAGDGADAAEGAAGELVIGGGGVAGGYRSRPELDQLRFVDDPVLGRAYRTGDVVRRDGEVVTFLGRVDDQVKVEGHRIELAEVERALAGVPGAAQVVVAAKGDPARLVAYVLADPRAGAVPPAELLARLREHGAALLSTPMLPTAAVVVDAFALTPSGKVDRARLPEPGAAAAEVERAPGSAGAATHGAPLRRDDVRATLAGWWAELLGRRRVRIDEDFFDLGGDSTLAVRLLARVQREWDVRLGLATLVSASTVAALADAVIATVRDGRPTSRSHCLVPFRSDRTAPAGRRPFVVVHGAGGNVLNLTPMARHLSESRPVLGVQAHGVDGSAEPDPSIDAMADRYVAELVTHQPVGPYLLGGYSGGGIVAIEMARRLLARGERVPVVLLFDSYPPGTDQPDTLGKVRNVARNVRHHGPCAVGRSLRAIARRRLAGEVVPGARELGYGDVGELGLAKVDGHFNRVAGRHRSTPVAVHAVLLRAEIIQASLPPTRDWRAVLAAPPDELVVPGHHYSMFEPAHAGALAAAVDGVLARVDPS